jgi:hypothetical protein
LGGVLDTATVLREFLEIQSGYGFSDLRVQARLAKIEIVPLIAKLGELYFVVS